jgi:hypothetical protein
VRGAISVPTAATELSASRLRISESRCATTTHATILGIPECSAERFDFGVVKGRAVEATFDAGTDRAVDLAV